MACRCVEVEPVDLLQALDDPEVLVFERRSLPFERMEDDSLEKIAESDVEVLCQAFQDL